MPAARKLLVDLLVTGAAIPGGHLRGDDEAVVLFLFLSLRGLVAIEARDSLGGVLAHLVFMHDRILLSQVTFGAFSSSADERSVWLVHFHARPGSLDQEGAQNKSEGNHDGHKYGTERHGSSPNGEAEATDRLGTIGITQEGCDKQREWEFCCPRRERLRELNFCL